MATFKIPEKYELMECPYNKLHMVEAYRFQRHLLKCKRFYPEKDFAHCVFNHTHVVPREKLGHHHIHCPDKARINHDVFQLSTDSDSLDDVVEKSGETTIQSSENWDDESPTVVQKLGGDGFKAVHSKKKSKEPRSTGNVEGWLSHQINAEDNHWEPPQEEVRLPKTLSKVMASGMIQHAPRTQNPPKVFSHSMALAGRGQRSVPQELLALGRGRGLGRGATGLQPVIPAPNYDSGCMTHSANTDTKSEGYSSASPSSFTAQTQMNGITSQACEPTPQINGISSHMNGILPQASDIPSMNGYVSDTSSLTSSPGAYHVNGASPAGRGRARGLTIMRRGGYVPSPGSSSTENDSDPGTGVVSREQLRVPSGLKRIAASLGQHGGPPGINRTLAEKETSDSSVNGDDMTEEQKKKQIRKLKKKISEIQILQKQQAAGRLLDPDQLKKLGTKEDFQSQLNALSIN